MELILQRLVTDAYGVFGTLSLNNEVLCYTGEHNYDGKPKLSAGTYTCQRGMHQLASMREPFETFEVLGVIGHTGILFHIGNFPQIDSEGCILVGEALASYKVTGNMLTNSRTEFALLMQTLAGVDTFTLTVVS